MPPSEFFCFLEKLAQNGHTKTVGSDDHYFVKAGEINTGLLTLESTQQSGLTTLTAQMLPKQCSSVLPFPKVVLLKVYVRSHTVSNSHPSVDSI